MFGDVGPNVMQQGSQQETGENSRMASFMGAFAICDLVKTTLGPKGMDKILQPMGGGAVKITNDGATILKSIMIDNQAAKVRRFHAATVTACTSPLRGVERGCQGRTWPPLQVVLAAMFSLLLLPPMLLRNTPLAPRLPRLPPHLNSHRSVGVGRDLEGAGR
jgi:hypothetical protein